MDIEAGCVNGREDVALILLVYAVPHSARVDNLMGTGSH